MFKWVVFSSIMFHPVSGNLGSPNLQFQHPFWHGLYLVLFESNAVTCVECWPGERIGCCVYVGMKSSRQ